MATKFKRGGIWYVKYKDVDGVWKNKSCGKKANKTAAEYLEKEYSARELNNYHSAPVKIIKSGLLDALHDFRDRILRRGSNGTVKQESSIRREQAVVNTFIDFITKRGFSEFKEMNFDTIQDFMDERAGKGHGKTGEGVKARTKLEERRVLRKFFRWSIEQNYCTNNLVEKIEVPRLPKSKPRFFSEDELGKIFAAAKDPYKDIFKFLYLTGLRTGELANLEWRDWKEKLDIMTIRVVSQNKAERTPGNKTKREETIPLSKGSTAILRKRKMSGDSKKSIFLNAEENRLDNENIYRNLKRILVNLEINDAHPHTFRHTFASHLVIKGVPIYTVKELMRHASVKETEVYAHLSKEATRSAVELISTEGLEDGDTE